MLGVESGSFWSQMQSAVELRAFLTENDAAVSEIWIYRWTT